MTFRHDTPREILVRLVSGILVAVVIFLFSAPSWTSYITSIALKALLAFLAIIAAAWTYMIYRRDPSILHAMFLMMLLASAFVQFGSAIDYLFERAPPTNLNTPVGITMDLLEVAYPAIIILAAVMRRNIERSIRFRRTVLAIGVTSILAIYGALYVLIMPGWTETVVQIFGTAIGIITMISVAIVVRYWYQNMRENKFYNTSYILASVILLGLATLPLIFSLTERTPFYGLGLTLQAAAFLQFSIGAAIPLQTSRGFSRRVAHLVPTVICMLAIVPFALSALMESIIPGLIIENRMTYHLSHFGAASLSGVLAFLYWRYATKKPAWLHYPIVFVFVAWTYVELHLIMQASVDSFLVLGESIIPYFFGATVLTIALIRAILAARKTEGPSSPRIWMLIRLIAFIVILWIAEIISQSFLPLIDINFQRLIFRSGLLGLSLAGLFLFAIIGFLLARREGSWLTIEGVVMASVSLLIATNILRAIFTTWTAGWWAAELILVVGLVLGPAMIGSVYLSSMTKAEDAKQRADLFSDLLVHDITNMHQAILVALSLLRMDGVDSKRLDRVVKEAEESLLRADHLIGNVRRIGLADQTGWAAFEPVDLVLMINKAYEQLSAEVKDAKIEFAVNRTENHTFTLANELLIDLFYNLFKNAYIYSPNEKKIIVEIEPASLRGDDYWEIRVIDFGRGIPPEGKLKLFRRFMEGAEGSGLGLSVVRALAKSYGGEVRVDNRVDGDYSKGTVFIIFIPAYLGNNISTR
ncbi:MAG: sensor histidine kinase [Candidatus Thorarchaeota archaeon]